MGNFVASRLVRVDYLTLSFSKGRDVRRGSVAQKCRAVRWANFCSAGATPPKLLISSTTTARVYPVGQLQSDPNNPSDTNFDHDYPFTLPL